MSKQKELPEGDILHLTLHRRWFDAIASGEKTEEYRAVTPFWIRRLADKEYSEIHFRNGYSVSVPWMRVQCLGIRIGKWNGENCFAISLGRILEVKNYEGNQTKAIAGLEACRP